MSFVVKEVELSNIRSHSHVVFRPETDGVTAILGKNGTGKSSIVDSIAWALFGTKFGKANNAAIMKSGVEYEKDKFFVKVRIEVGGQELLVERKFTSKAGTGVTATLYEVRKKEAADHNTEDGDDTDDSSGDDSVLIVDGDEAATTVSSEGAENGDIEDRGDEELIRIAGPSVSDTQKAIRQRLGMDERGFLSSVLVQQKQVDKLVLASARERAEVIEDLTGITALTQALTAARSDYNALKKAATVSSADAEGIKEAEDKAQKLRLEANVVKQDILDRKDDLKVLKTQGMEMREKYDKAKEILRKKDKLESDLRVAESKYADTVTARDEAIEERNELKKGLDGMTSAESAEAVIDERDRTADEVSELSAEMSSLQTRIKASEKSISTDKADIESFFNVTVGEKYDDFLRENLSAELYGQAEEISEVDVIDYIETVRSHVQSSVKESADEKIQQAQQNISSHKASIESLSQAVEVLSHEDGTCPTCLQTVSDADDAVAGLNTQIEQHQKSIEETQSSLGGFREASQIAEGFVTRADDAHTALADKAHQEKELYRLKANLEVSSGEHREAKDKLESLKKKADKVSSVIYRTQEYQRALNRAQKLSRDASELDIRVQGIREDLREQVSISEGKLAKFEKTLDKKREEHQRKDLELTERKGELSLVKEQLQSEERHLRKLREDYDKHQKLMKTLAISSSSMKIIEEFRIDQIESSIPVIENYASDFISRFTDSKFVRMQMDSSFNASVMLANGVTRPVNTLSGGELSSAAIALRLAISMLLGGGSQSSSLLLDEILTAVDDERSDSILATIKEVVQGQVILISHSGHVNDIADKVFEL